MNNLSDVDAPGSRPPKTELRCRCGCLLAKVSVNVGLRFDESARGIEIRCRRCKSHALLVLVAER